MNYKEKKVHLNQSVIEPKETKIREKVIVLGNEENYVVN